MSKLTNSRAGKAALYLLLLLFVQQSCKKQEIQVVPLVTISDISKTQLNIGDTLIIRGSNFDPVADRNLVSVATVSFPVIQAAEDQLSVVVPNGAQSGTLSVGFAGGKATPFDQPITIVGATQPVITSISPIAAYEGDTITVTGKNFGTPYTANSILFNGSQTGRIVNASAGELRVIVPDMSDTGPVQVTTNGQTSTPYAYTISKPDPTVDGRLYWMTLSYDLLDPYSLPAEMTQVSFSKGMSNTGAAQSSVLFSNTGTIYPKNPEYYSNKMSYELTNFTICNYVVNDLQHNAYYLTSTSFPFPAEYRLMKMPVDDPAHPVSVWSMAYPNPGPVTTIKDEYGWPAEIPYVPQQQIGMDGNTIYVKLGTSDDYYTGDVSQATPTLTLQHQLIGDSTAFNLQFGKDYIFYLSARYLDYYSASYGSSDSLYYTRKGSKVVQSAPIGLRAWDESIVSIMADPAHGNELLIVAFGYDAASGGYGQTIRKFNADTRQTTMLYSASNWPDALYPGQSQGAVNEGNTGFIWLGDHIYYAYPKSGGAGTTLHRIDADGRSSKPLTVYGRLEPMTTSQGYRFNFFLGK